MAYWAVSRLKNKVQFGGASYYLFTIEDETDQ